MTSKGELFRHEDDLLYGSIHSGICHVDASFYLSID
ncbi:hypothetical protein AVDCRST_MAG81-1612 [uncultured Synechococcales cyanobacterium]|uniref:Uncharacterized protein n=1 Tax=uncultured Synechococcales cyanobacterium TaxID=1936017 RepID=A0A6J4V8B3_9CYAN|nr:hypothetical protein AVDCRST_MAG81-1612 [uncultured Synechococcales cyanobacterium]